MSVCCRSLLEGADSAAAHSSLRSSGATVCPVHLRCVQCSSMRAISPAPAVCESTSIRSPKRFSTAAAILADASLLPLMPCFLSSVVVFDPDQLLAELVAAQHRDESRGSVLQSLRDGLPIA